MLTATSIAQTLSSGLLTGLIYALVAVGLSLVFGLMNVVNFAHGEFLMIAMYTTFGLALAFSLDPLVAAPIVMAVLFAIGALAYLVIVSHAMRAKVNAGMVQIFATFGLAIFIRGLAQYFLTPDYRSITHSWLGGKTYALGGIYFPASQLAGALISILAFIGLWLLITRTDFGKAIEATREDADAVALVGISKRRIFALGWGLGAALVGLAGAILASFYYIHPNVGGPFALIAYVTVALGGFGSVFGALAAGVIVGLVEALTVLILPAELKSLGIYAVYLVVVMVRPRGLFGSL